MSETRPKELKALDICGATRQRSHWELSMLMRALMILIGMAPGFVLAVALAAIIKIH